MVTTTIHILNAKHILDRARASSLLAGPIRVALTKSAYTVEKSSKGMTPVDTGRLRASITHVVDASSVPHYATVGTNVIYARYVHDGRRQGARQPPTAAIALWARRHGNINPYVLARAIKRRGIKPRPFLRDAFNENISAIRGYFQSAAREIERLWSQGA